MDVFERKDNPDCSKCEWHKRQADRLREKLKQMQDDVKGWEERERSLLAMVTAIIAAVGADTEHPVKVSKKAISAAMEGRPVVIAHYNAETEEYSLFVHETTR